MNTTALKSFAPAVRRKLMEAVTRKLDFVLAAQTPDYVTTFASQVAVLRRLAQSDRNALVERVAYTWFNRLTALRYLDARGWHPFRARVLTPASADETQPELLKLTRAGAIPEDLRRHMNPARLNGLLDGHIPSPDPQGEVYRHLVLAACRFYHALLPNLFERLDDDTELLLPDDLLTEHSVAQGFRNEITDEDCADAEVLGWLYQFYISEKKDEVMGRKSAVPAEDIPAVTQLFTPHWIVRYLVENSLGRLWLLNRPDSLLRTRMPYFIEGDAGTDFIKVAKPQDIRIFDPACGSGHILTYAFDLLYAIYEEEGYSSGDIPNLILANNLHGSDICPRATQLAALALTMKCREHSSRYFQSHSYTEPSIVALDDVHLSDAELNDYSRALHLGHVISPAMRALLHQFDQASNVGALVLPSLDARAIADARTELASVDVGNQLFLQSTHLRLLQLLQQAEVLAQRYHVVITNPPYMSGVLNDGLGQFVEAHYSDSKKDMSAAFLSRCLSLTRRCGYSALVVCGKQINDYPTQRGRA